MTDPTRTATRRATIVLVGSALIAPATRAQWSPFAVRVLDFSPAPGQFVQHSQFNDPSRALGPPVGGGTIIPDTTKVVSLGGFGGSITLAFDHRVMDDPRNPMGLDAIVYGNASFVAGNPNRRFAEAATIEIAIDANHNALADDPWYVIRAPTLPNVPAAALSTRTWDDNIPDPLFPPGEPLWIPPGRTGQWQTRAYELPSLVFGVVVLQNPLGLASSAEGVWGVADHTPTLRLGDTNADNVVDAPGARPEWFYTVPDDPLTVGISPASGGGDAFDIAWSVDPETGLPSLLPGFDFIRMTTGVDAVNPVFGEVSTEVCAVADVRPGPHKGVAPAQWVGVP